LHIIYSCFEHRAGKDAEGKTGDGVGILLQISHKFFKKAVKPTGIMLKFRSVKTRLFDFIFHKSNHPFVYSKALQNLEHRAGKDAEGKTGDGVGILLQISHKFFKKAVFHFP